MRNAFPTIAGPDPFYIHYHHRTIATIATPPSNFIGHAQYGLVTPFATGQREPHWLLLVLCFYCQATTSYLLWSYTYCPRVLPSVA